MALRESITPSFRCWLRIRFLVFSPTKVYTSLIFKCRSPIDLDATRSSLAQVRSGFVGKFAWRGRCNPTTQRHTTSSQLSSSRPRGGSKQPMEESKPRRDGKNAGEQVLYIRSPCWFNMESSTLWSQRRVAETAIYFSQL